MKNLLALLCAFLCCTTFLYAADDYTPLPFSVSIGGQAAQLKGKAEEATHATIDKPVAANAALEVGAKSDMIIVNVVSANDKGVPTEGAAPAVLIIQGNGGKSSLDKTMDGKKFAAGNYLLTAVADGKSATVFFKIQ